MLKRAASGVAGLRYGNGQRKTNQRNSSGRVAQTTDHFPSRKQSEHESTTGCPMLRFVKRAALDFSASVRMVNMSLIYTT